MFAQGWIQRWQPELLTGARIVLVIALGIVVNLIARRSIARVVAGVRVATRELDQRGSALLRGEQAQRAQARADTLNSVLRSLSSTLVFLTVTLVVLGQLNINLAPLIAGAGVASIAVGFGAQSLVRDVVAGIFVLLEDQYGVGDTIDAGAAVGEVERFTLRVTRVRDTAGTVWHIPNGSIQRVGNKSQNWARAVVEITVPADSDIRRVRSVIAAASADLAADPVWADGAITGPADELGLVALNPTGATLRVVVETLPAAQWKVERELRQRIKDSFDREGLTFAVAEPPGSAPATH